MCEKVEGWKAADRARRRQGGTWMSLELILRDKKRYFLWLGLTKAGSFGRGVCCLSGKACEVESRQTGYGGGLVYYGQEILRIVRGL